MFDRATIECNDDGTYSLSVTPPPKEKKDDDGATVPSYGRDKRATCQSLEEVGVKIRELSKGGEPEKEKTEKGEMDEYFNGDKYTAEKEEE